MGNILASLGNSKIYKWVANFALFGFTLTLAAFMFEQYRSAQQTKEIVDNLVYVQKSLSTKYLGVFPDYLDHINEILEGAQPKDTIVIFEDVLYYGFISKPEEFKHMHQRLIAMADSGANVTIAYYNPKGRNFRRMIIDQYIATNLSAQMDQERRALYSHREKGTKRDIKELMSMDSALCDEYFNQTRASDPDKFKRGVDKNRKSLAKLTGKETGLKLELELLYAKIDSVKSKHLEEDYDELCLHDFENMYRKVSMLMSDEYIRHGIELIPIDENLSISCWLVSDKAIMAFPSKYATDEIGFYSQDPAFSKYIKTMLNGFRGNYSNLSPDPQEIQ